MIIYIARGLYRGLRIAGHIGFQCHNATAKKHARPPAMIHNTHIRLMLPLVTTHTSAGWQYKVNASQRGSIICLFTLTTHLLLLFIMRAQLNTHIGQHYEYCRNMMSAR